MATSRDYYGSMSKSRRSSPSMDAQGSGFFQTGQGGRPVLPPLSPDIPNSPFPGPTLHSTQYNQPRSTPSRYDYNPVVYNQWSPNVAPSQPSYGYYNPEDTRYTHTMQQSYGPSRASPAPPDHPPTESRKLPPLSSSPGYGGRDERWQTAPYPPSAMGGSHIRSPTASYPSSYAPYGANPSTHYTYNSATHHAQVPSMTPHPSSLAAAMPGQRSGSPYGRGASHPTSYSPPPLSPTTSEEPTIKKKRKRADAAQLKILTETYNRTAFPSTEERLALAKLLDMTPRSVQIWFQNRRQSMRQTRQSGTTTGQQGMSSTDPLDEMTMSSGNYDIVSTTPYMHDTPTLTSAHRRPRSQEEVDSRKSQWPRY